MVVPQKALESIGKHRVCVVQGGPCRRKLAILVGNNPFSLALGMLYQHAFPRADDPDHTVHMKIPPMDITY